MADWITLTKTRRQTWRAWLLFMSLVLLLLIGQTVGGAWEGSVPRVWTWLLANLLPSLALLLAGLLIDRRPRAMIPAGAHAALVGSTAAYGALTLFSLVSGSIFGPDELSAIDRLEQTYWWLLPIQAVLLGGYYLVFFRGETVFQPNEQLIRNAATKSASEAARKDRPVQEQCRNFTAAAQYELAFELMRSHFDPGSPVDLDTLLVLQSQYTLLMRERQEGLLDPAAAQIQLNRITAALLNLSEQIKA